jgi:hypothetical protein
MAPLFGAGGTNFENLIHPQTAAARTNALVLRETYKIDPVFAQKVDAQYGPLDWRLPEAHAIYWYALGLEKAREHPDKVKPDDLINCAAAFSKANRPRFATGASSSIHSRTAWNWHRISI